MTDTAPANLLTVRNAVTGLALAIGLAFSATTPAHAGIYGAPVRFSCGAGKIAVLKFTVVNDYVRIGFATNSYDAGFDNMRELDPGKRSVNTGLSAGYWQHWAHGGTGAISAYSVTCVTYLLAPITP